MMTDRAAAYDERRSGAELAVFLVDVPLARDGRIGLVYPDHRRSEPGWRVRPVGTAQIVDLIMRGGYLAESQAVQFLAAPRTPQQYEVFAREAQLVADALGRDVYIVGEAGAVVHYDEDPGTFVADDEGGDAVPWTVLRSAVAEVAALDPAGEGEELPAYFGTYETGALAERFAVSPFGTYANLVTFESDDVIDEYVDQYDAYEDEGGGDLALVVLPTRDGLPANADDEGLSARTAADVVVGLRLNDRPVRLLFRPLDDAPSAPVLADWVSEFATRT